MNSRALGYACLLRPSNSNYLEMQTHTVQVMYPESDAYAQILLYFLKEVNIVEVIHEAFF